MRILCLHGMGTSSKVCKLHVQLPYLGGEPGGTWVKATHWIFQMQTG